MSKSELYQMVENEIKKRDYWIQREIHACWNDDGKGGHIDAKPMIIKYNARIELLNELISKTK